MRSLLLTVALLAALVLPTVSAAHVQGATDGTLSIRDGRGKVTMAVRGGVIGSFAAGSVTITDPVDGDGTGPIVTGDEWSKDRSDTTTTWGGTRVRFRIIGGSFRVVVRGRGVNLSLIGKGNVKIEGAGSENDGSYSVNGGDYSGIPALFAFPLSATSP
jgi:opacity protein-like surface antigen